jgi:predicted O-methyltransferase YrrM
MLGRSQDIGKKWDKAIDFMWIDGSHDYEDVREDILAWSPWVVEGGIIAVHDCFDGEPPAHNPSGAGQAVRELINAKWLIMNCDRIRAFQRIPDPGQGWLGDLLFELASETKTGCIVELGAYHGRGTISLARGARVGHGARVYTIDDFAHRKEPFGTRYYGPPDKEVFRANIKRADVDVTLINKDISEAAKTWKEPIGLLSWDICGEDRFWADWLDWSKHMVPDGAYIIKDTDNGDCGTRPHIESILESGAFVVGNSLRGGVIVLRKK